MKKIVIINGSGGSGKSTFCKLCNDITPCIEVSTVDKVKEAYEILGWNRKKTEEDRKNLSDIKEIASKRFDHPYKYINQKIEEFMSNTLYTVLFINSREPEEIKRFVDDFKGITLLVKNNNVKSIISNHSDAEVSNYNYDYIIDNNGDTNDLKKQAIKFIEEIKSS